MARGKQKQKMNTKHIAVELVQDDIDYLLHRACECMKKMTETKYQHEKVHYYQLFECYRDLYYENRDRVKEKK